MTVVTLVHGTWAPRAAWCEPQSNLCSALRAMLGPDVRFERFQWSGRNTHAARENAAVLLSRHIGQCQEQYPGHKQFVVAHSHGGTVTLYALRDPVTRSQISGTVTISTPFIVCRSRATDGIPFEGIGVLLSLVAVWTGMNYLRQFMSKWVAAPLLVIGLFGVIVLVMFALGLLNHLVFRGKSRSEILASFSYPQLKTGELLIVRSAGDEASGLLAVSFMAGWCLAAFSKLVNLLYVAGLYIGEAKVLLGAKPRILLGTGGLLVSWMAIAYAPLCGRWLIFWFCAVTIALSVSLLVPFINLFPFLGMAVQAACGLLLLPVLTLMSVCAIPFGIDMALVVLFFDLSAEASPPGTFNVAGNTASATLAHSASYDDAETLASISQWLRERHDSPSSGA